MFSRGKERDVEQERSMAKTVDLFNRALNLEMTEEQGWFFMVCLKIARATTNGEFNSNLDSVEDCAAYLALLGESISSKKDSQNL